jgi:hypothetical protein
MSKTPLGVESCPCPVSGSRRTARRTAWPVITLVAVLATSCGGDRPGTTPTPPNATISDLARTYLDELIRVMESNSINRLTIDWARFRSDVFAQAGAAQTITDTYSAIREALRLLGDGHSSYRSATGTVIFVPTRTCRPSGAGVPSMPTTIGYVKVTAFSGSGGEATAFASAIHGAIRASDRPGLAGWIVDLRGNGGGNMWPMIAGVGPVLGEGVLGYFINPFGFESVWEYRDGASWNGGVILQRVDAPYTLIRPRPRVAVLVDNGIASSGEATAIAFKQRPDTRFFGAATCGLSTSNNGYPLRDGAQLILTVSVMADRTKARYGDSVQPDETVTDTTQVFQRAIEWLQGSGS